MTDQAEQKRIISIIEDIEHVDAIVSSLDYEISVASEDDKPNLEDQFRRFRGQSNGMVNYLKGEGYTLTWDGAIIHVDKDGNPWMFKNSHGDWVEAIMTETPEQEQARLEANVERLRKELEDAKTRLRALYATKTAKMI